MRTIRSNVHYPTAVVDPSPGDKVRRGIPDKQTHDFNYHRAEGTVLKRSEDDARIERATYTIL
jgi:hypothetical protein